MVRVLSGAWRAVAMSIVLGMAAVAATAFGAPGDLDVSGFNAADPVVTNRGKALARPGRSAMTPDAARGVARQADGKLLVAGSCSGLVTTKLCVVRFDANGTPDLTFNPDATQGGLQPDLQAGELIIEITPSQSLFAMVAVQSDQKIIVAGTCSNLTSGYFDFCIVRLHPDASVDTSFNAAGVTPGVATVAPGNFYNVARGLMLQPDGKIVIVGSCGATIVATAMCISRHNTNGTLDASFNPGGAVPGTRIETIGNSNDSYATSVARQSDGKLVVAGSCVHNSNNEFCLFRLSDTGALDSAGFGASGKVITAVNSDEDTINAVVIQADGKIVVAGACSSGGVYSSNGATKFCVARYATNGTLDTAGFNAAAPLVADRGKLMFAFDSDYDGVNAAFVQPDGKLMLAGRCRADPMTGTGVFCSARLLSDGGLDATWGAAGKAIEPNFANQRDLTFAALLQPDGDLVFAGDCFRGAPDAFCVARFTGGPVVPPACALNVDGNGFVDPATDGVLIIRYLLGFRGSALTTGALGGSPARTGTTLETWIAGLNLDADGDGGGARATSDGLLLLRAMLGLTGSALTQGATNAPSATRNAADIVTWIQQAHGAGCLPTS
ncbi:MAG TPA: hypothetical protein PK586_07480 [Casimicrobium sp.]|mgnify:FL=1|nr:hypothetical protein [Casimicrobium sp.]